MYFSDTLDPMTPVQALRYLVVAGEPTSYGPQTKSNVVEAMQILVRHDERRGLPYLWEYPVRREARTRPSDRYTSQPSAACPGIVPELKIKPLRPAELATLITTQSALRACLGVARDRH